HILLAPGSTTGALHIAKILREKSHQNITISTFSTLPYAARAVKRGEVEVYLKVKTLYFSSFPVKEMENEIRLVRDLFPGIRPMSCVLEVDLNNGNPITHPAPTLLNCARIENDKGNFLFYRDGISKSVAKINEKLDQERLKICQKFGFAEIPATKRLFEMGYIDKVYKTLYEAYIKSEAFKNIKAPSNLFDRYIEEDVAYGLVTMVSIGKMVKVITPTMELIVNLANLINEKNYWETGLTMEKLGLSHLNKEEFLKFLKEGRSNKVNW
ncbi:MAG: NAD/NADP octopine/nopaline dehydrogenase family protein, partial [Deltaproteobacteria bacterium]|nr:NAD/NADP octopine/nopaline dehydrogenase family protein [Deltaproteobacteria bacterium]